MANSSDCPHGFPLSEADRCPHCRALASTAFATLPGLDADASDRTAPPSLSADDQTLMPPDEPTSLAPPITVREPECASSPDVTLPAEVGQPRRDASDATYQLPEEAGPSIPPTVNLPNIAPFTRPPEPGVTSNDAATVAPDESLPASVVPGNTRWTAPTEPPDTVDPLAATDGRTLNEPSASSPPPTTASDIDLALWQHSRAPSVAPLEDVETLMPPEESPAPPASGKLTADPYSTKHLADDHRMKPGTVPQPSPSAAASSRISSGRRDVPKAESFPPVAGYELLKELGRGGMGVVYKARHLKLNRIVALKMILSGGRAGRAEMARFNAEAQAVAQLQHPNIVQVFEFGESAGQPFFSLEFVEGGTLEDKAGYDPQPPIQAVRVVEQLAEAMDLAHRRGILHRDLKPANVLMEGASAAPLDQCVPKITDFGLAKRIESGNSSQTRDGSVMGTPSYMPPEQAEGRIKELGPPADVYALGAILYHLITGRPPFRGSTVMDTLNQVINNEPVPPVQMQPGLPRDVQIICLKCLEKDPGKRYAAAGELAADLRRFLENKPILARATPAWERAWKWMRRHPTRAGLIGVSAAAIAILTIGGYLFALREQRRATEANELRQKAEDNAERADKNAERADKTAAAEAKARVEADEQRFLAVESLKQSREAVDFITQLGQERLARVPQMELLRREILETSLAFNQRFVKTHGHDPALVRECGVALLRAGEIHELLGRDDKAEEAYLAAPKLFDELLKASPGNPDYRRNLAATWNDLAILRQKRGKPQEAEDAFYQAIQLKTALAQQFDGEADWQRELASSYDARGNLYQSLKRPDDAEKDYREALRLLQSLPARTGAVVDSLALARTDLNFGAFLLTQKPKEAEPFLKAAERLLLDFQQRSADDPRWRVTLALVYRNLAILHHTQRPLEVDQVAAEYEKARALHEELARLFANVPEYRQELVKTCMNLAKLWLDTNRPRDLDKVCRQAVPLLRDLVKEFPEESIYQHLLGRGYNFWAIAQFQLTQDADAEKSWRDGIAVQERLRDTYPERPEYWQDLIESRTNFARCLAAVSPTNEAEKAVEQLVALHEDRVKAFPTVDNRSKLAGAWHMKAELLLQRNKLPTPTEREAREAAVVEQRAVWKALREMTGPQRLAARKALTDYSLTLIRALLKLNDHRAASTAVTELQRDVPAEGMVAPGLTDRDAAVLLVQCLQAVEKDTGLTAEKRLSARDSYAGQAVTLLRRAAEINAKAVQDLKTALEFQPLRERDDYKKLIAEIEAKNGK